MDTAVRSYRDQFPITARGAYLNHAATGPFSRPVVAAIARYVDGQAASANRDLDVPAFRSALRAKMAGLINARPEEIAVTKNTPEGISTVASGLSWQAGDNVVTTAIEFPANIYPWLNLESRGVQTRLVPAVDGRVSLESIVAAIDDRTRVVAVSFVEFSTGFRHDLAALGAICRPRGIRLVVDAIQGLGVLPIDVAAMQVDFLASSSHKWLCAPQGVGWFYCRQELLDTLALHEIGQSSVVARPSYLDYELRLKPTAERFEPGVSNGIGLVGLDASLDLFQSVGTHEIERRLLALTDQLAEELPRRGYRVRSPRATNGEKSGILTFDHPSHGSAEVVDALGARDVVVSLREGVVRVSPNFYNDASEIERLLEALPR